MLFISSILLIDRLLNKFILFPSSRPAIKQYSLILANVVYIQFQMQGENRLGQFQVESKLGEGSFSIVYKVRRTDDGKYYAMKKVKIGQMKEKEKQNALNQVRILASISHPNIVNYREAFFDDRSQTLCIVMELADAGDIQKKINHHISGNTHFNEAELWQALIQMTRGLKALHQINILHRDLKCANVFCTSDRVYKLGDLNVSKVAKRGMARTQTGTPYYTSPEVWNDRPYDAKCDIWSLGCVIYQMATLRPPFRANNLKELYAKIQKGIYEPIPKFYSQDLRQVVSLCLKVSPSQRISAVQILSHQYVLKNMPASEIQNQNNSQTSKCNLLKTIMVPKNLKSLKEALPASKYDQPSKSQDLNKMRRANSANQLRKDLPQVIESPKGQQNQQVKYALMRRPSQEYKQPVVHSQLQEPVRALPRMERNNSVDYIRARIQSNQSIQNSRRKDSSRQISRQLPKPVQRPIRQAVRPPSVNRQVPRPSSRQRIISQQKARQNSRDRVNSKDSRGNKQVAEDVKNRCKDIEQKIKLLMQRKREEKQQRNPNLPAIKPTNNSKDLKYNYQQYQRPSSRERQMSKNKSVELARQESLNSARPDPRKINDRPPSRERVASMQRAGSKEAQRRRYGPGPNRYVS